jgi:hypothetical protein
MSITGIMDNGAKIPPTANRSISSSLSERRLSFREGKWKMGVSLSQWIRS